LTHFRDIDSQLAIKHEAFHIGLPFRVAAGRRGFSSTCSDHVMASVMLDMLLIAVKIIEVTLFQV
jgi:hypothetical protein